MTDRQSTSRGRESARPRGGAFGAAARLLGGLADAFRSAAASLLGPASPSARAVLSERGEEAEWGRGSSADEPLASGDAAAAGLLTGPEERMRAIFEHSAIAILILERNGLVADANPAAIDALGLSLPALLRMSVLELVGQESRGEFRGALQRMVEGEATHARGEFDFAHPDGRTRSMVATFSAVRATTGATAFIALILEDVTERRRLELQLRQAQKMEAIGRLAGGVAHDFNNILTAIQGQAQFAREELLRTGGATDDADQILRTTERAAMMTRQLLAFSRKQRNRPERVDLNGVVAGLESMVGRLLGSSVELCTRAAPAPVHIYADPGQIQQVVLNLIVNARDALPPEGGRITVSTGEADVDGGAVASLIVPVPPGRYATIAVEDTGRGIEAGVLAHIFEPFFTTKAEEQGTGLGLATVYGAVERAGGSIRVETELGRGTRFTVYLPPA